MGLFPGLVKWYRKNIGGKAPSSLNCMILEEWGEIVDVALPVKKGYLTREKTDDVYEEWGMDIGNQVFDKEFGHMQVISARDTAPLPLWHDNKKTFTKELLHTIAEMAADLQLLIIHKHAVKERIWTLIMITGVALAIVVVLIVGIPAFQRLRG
jgi:hypothetical protein